MKDSVSRRRSVSASLTTQLIKAFNELYSWSKKQTEWAEWVTDESVDCLSRLTLMSCFLSCQPRWMIIRNALQGKGSLDMRIKSSKQSYEEEACWCYLRRLTSKSASSSWCSSLSRASSSLMHSLSHRPVQSLLEPFITGHVRRRKLYEGGFSSWNMSW